MVHFVGTDRPCAHTKNTWRQANWRQFTRKDCGNYIAGEMVVSSAKIEKVIIGFGKNRPQRIHWNKNATMFFFLWWKNKIDHRSARRCVSSCIGVYWVHVGFGIISSPRLLQRFWILLFCSMRCFSRFHSLKFLQQPMLSHLSYDIISWPQYKTNRLPQWMTHQTKHSRRDSRQKKKNNDKRLEIVSSIILLP